MYLFRKSITGHHIFLTLSKRGLHSIFIPATTHSYSHSCPFPLSLTSPWPYHISTARHWRKTGEKHENEVSQQFLSSTPALVRGDEGTHHKVRCEWALDHQTTDWQQTFPNAWNWITGESHPADKALGEKTHSAVTYQHLNATKHRGYCPQSHVQFPYKKAIPHS